MVEWARGRGGCIGVDHSKARSVEVDQGAKGEVFAGVDDPKSYMDEAGFKSTNEKEKQLQEF